MFWDGWYSLHLKLEITKSRSRIRFEVQSKGQSVLLVVTVGGRPITVEVITQSVPGPGIPVKRFGHRDENRLESEQREQASNLFLSFSGFHARHD